MLQAGQQAASALGAPDTAAAASQQQTSNAIAGMSPKQLYDILKALKGQIEVNPEKGRAVLRDNLPLAKALFQAQIILGMVNPEPKTEEGGAQAGPEVKQEGASNGAQASISDPAQLGAVPQPGFVQPHSSVHAGCSNGHEFASMHPRQLNYKARHQICIFQHSYRTQSYQAAKHAAVDPSYTAATPQQKHQ